MNYRVALSYAGEDRRFVEHVAAILERFLGEQSVFHYTTAAKSTTINAFFEFINECLSTEPPLGSKDVVRTVCFVREVKDKARVVVGQQTELLDRDAPDRKPQTGFRTWQGLTNSRQAARLNLKTISVALPSHGMTPKKLEQWTIPFDLRCFGQATDICPLVTDIDRSSAEHVAEFVLRDMLGLPSQPHSCKAFTYEKDAISFYASLLTHLRRKPFCQLEPKIRANYEDKFMEGVPLVWPTVRLRTDLTLRPNALIEEGAIGCPRKGLDTLLPGQAGADGSVESEKMVLSAALSHHHACAELNAYPDACMIRSGLCFPEAGPRAEVMRKHPEVGIVVCGGIAPGVNAVIDGIVRRHENYDSNCEVCGFKYGLRALSQVPGRMSRDRIELSSSTTPGKVNTANYVSQGGSLLGTFRLERLDGPSNKTVLDRVMVNMEGLDILYVIGGDGSMKAASFLAQEIRERGLKVSVVGIPKTTDNDILWVWQSFGFATAVEKAREIINCLSTEVLSNPRICVLQLFGSVSGFVVSHAVLSSQSGQCDAALIPEARFTIEALAEKLLERFKDDNGDIDSTQLPYGMIVMAETAIPEDAQEYVGDAKLSLNERAALREYRKQETYMDGQTNDDLRSASLKLVVHGLSKELNKRFDKVRIFTNEPRHILRATNPSFSDIITGQRLGSLAVDNAMAGYSDFMVSQWLTEFVLVPLRLVALGRKRIPESGIFWKSVLAKTGQGELAPQNKMPSGTSRGSDYSGRVATRRKRAQQAAGGDAVPRT